MYCLETGKCRLGLAETDQLSAGSYELRKIRCDRFAPNRALTERAAVTGKGALPQSLSHRLCTLCARQKTFFISQLICAHSTRHSAQRRWIAHLRLPVGAKVEEEQPPHCTANACMVSGSRAFRSAYRTLPADPASGPGSAGGGYPPRISVTSSGGRPQRQRSRHLTGRHIDQTSAAARPAQSPVARQAVSR